MTPDLKYTLVLRIKSPVTPKSNFNIRARRRNVVAFCFSPLSQSFLLYIYIVRACDTAAVAAAAAASASDTVKNDDDGDEEKLRNNGYSKNNDNNNNNNKEQNKKKRKRKEKPLASGRG